MKGVQSLALTLPLLLSVSLSQFLALSLPECGGSTYGVHFARPRRAAIRRSIRRADKDPRDGLERDKGGRECVGSLRFSAGGRSARLRKGPAALSGIAQIRQDPGPSAVIHDVVRQAMP